MACIYLAVNSTIGLTTLACVKTLLAIQGGKQFLLSGTGTYRSAGLTSYWLKGIKHGVKHTKKSHEKRQYDKKDHR